jgi:hypothetical protein
MRGQFRNWPNEVENDDSRRNRRSGGAALQIAPTGSRPRRAYPFWRTTDHPASDPQFGSLDVSGSVRRRRYDLPVPGRSRDRVAPARRSDDLSFRGQVQAVNSSSKNHPAKRVECIALSRRMTAALRIESTRRQPDGRPFRRFHSATRIAPRIMIAAIPTTTMTTSPALTGAAWRYLGAAVMAGAAAIIPAARIWKALMLVAQKQTHYASKAPAMLRASSPRVNYTNEPTANGATSKPENAKTNPLMVRFIRRISQTNPSRAAISGSWGNPPRTGRNGKNKPTRVRRNGIVQLPNEPTAISL